MKKKYLTFIMNHGDEVGRYKYYIIIAPITNLIPKNSNSGHDFK